MKSLLKITFVIVSLSICFFNFAQASFVCEQPEIIMSSQDDDGKVQWISDANFSKIEISKASTPNWDIKVFGPAGSEVFTGQISGVGYHDVSKLDEDTLDYIYLVSGLDQSSNEIEGYQLYPIDEDGGDGTGFSILELFVLGNDGVSLVSKSAVYSLGWGFGRCKQYTPSTKK